MRPTTATLGIRVTASVTLRELYGALDANGATRSNLRSNGDLVRNFRLKLSNAQQDAGRRRWSDGFGGLVGQQSKQP